MLQSGRIVHANEINYTTKMNFYQLHLIKLCLLAHFAYEKKILLIIHTEFELRCRAEHFEAGFEKRCLT